MYVKLERIFGAKVRWAYRGGPGFKRKPVRGCDLTKKTRGQLVTDHGEYKPGFVDYVPPKKENCKTIKVSAFPTCGVIHRCFTTALARIDKCCIEYKPIPAPLGLGTGCNSNCVVGWLLGNCIKAKGIIAFIPLPVGKLAPGVFVPRPRCVRQPPKPKPKRRRRMNTVCTEAAQVSSEGATKCAKECSI